MITIIHSVRHVRVGPPATALRLVRKAWACMVVSVGLGWLAVAVGLLHAQRYDTAVGATMAAVSVGLFFLVLAFRGVRERTALQSA